MDYKHYESRLKASKLRRENRLKLESVMKGKCSKLMIAEIKPRMRTNEKIFPVGYSNQHLMNKKKMPAEQLYHGGDPLKNTKKDCTTARRLFSR